ncbi:DoxX family protein [Celerinatantimonas sp. YJH-8]|uniref:DoxX family protein n=1 Tax=Celerinatantimonas sp. YJH-8 TaxID=3228714 RepID=UPI0038CBC903
MNTKLQPEYAATILRITLGVMYLAHGLTKLLVFTPQGTAQFFASLGVPGFLGPIVMTAELLAALGLILGVKARWAALLLIPTLMGTIILVHGHNGFSFANQGGGWEYPMFLITVSLASFFAGNGALALENVLFRSKAYSQTKANA